MAEAVAGGKRHTVARSAAALVAFILALGVLPVPSQARRDPGDGCDARRADRRHPPATTAAMHLVIDGRHGAGRAGERIAGDTSDIRIVVEWKGLSGAHVQRLELASPDGVLHGAFTTPFRAHGTTTVVETVVPVAGTIITDAGLYGAWCAAVFAGGDAAPAAVRSFVLVEPR